MDTTIEKIESFLFEIIGLLIPGIIFIVLPELIYYQLTGLDLPYWFNIKKQLVTSNINNLWLLLFLIFAYFCGNLVKVFSKELYSICRAIFDNNINRLLGYICNKIKSWTKYTDWLEGIKNFLKIFSTFFSILKKGFIFQTADYPNSSETLLVSIKKKLKEKDLLDDNLKWFSYYKFSDIIQSNENIKSLCFKFLAKYNFYRSMSFIAVLNLLLSLYWVIKHDLLNFRSSVVLILLLAFYLTFHDKYKTYWMLCGNEAILGLYYFIFVKNNTEIKNQGD
ncbi:MAG: hypothetical protein AB1782_03450 [Cyanobacteriota bacterium]